MSAADLRRAALGPPTVPEDAAADHVSESMPIPLAARTRARGQTISFADTRRDMSKSEGYGHPVDEADELNPVEWIMVTRSDPGGSVPRFLVERGTPGGIVGDAGKWLQWAATKDHGPPGGEGEGVDDKHSGLEAQQTNGHLAGLEDDRGSLEEEADKQVKSDTNKVALKEGVEPFPPIEEPTIPTSEAAKTSTTEEAPPSLVSSAIGLARSSLETYAPKIVLDHLPRQPSPLQKSTSDLVDESNLHKDAASGSDSDSTMSTTGSFVSVVDRFENDDDEERKSTTDATSSSQKAPRKDENEEKEPVPSIQEQQRALTQASGGDAADPLSSSPELVKIRQRRKTLDTKFQQLKQKELEKILKEKGQPPALVALAQQKAALAETKSTGAASAASLSSETLDKKPWIDPTATTAQQQPPRSSSSSSQKNEIPLLETNTLLEPETSLLLTTRLQKAHQKHARESAKQDLKYQQTVAKLVSKREKLAKKEEARKMKDKKEQSGSKTKITDKDGEKEKEKEEDKYTALENENQRVRKLLEKAREEAEAMETQIRELQRENTGLVAGVGKLDGGAEVVREVKARKQE